MNFENGADVRSESIEFGAWKLERVLGSGAFGKVLLFKNNDDGKQVAIKKCHTSVRDNLPQWEREISILHKLSHPGLVTALAVPEELKVLEIKGIPILCMEFCSGGDLRKILNKPENACGLPEKDILLIASDLASALVYLHSVKIVHRDLKPENVVIQKTDGRAIYKLADLGFAKDLSKQSICNTLVGTSQYLAPELFICEKYTNTADYWSLGVIVHECITGIRPFLPGFQTVQWMQFVGKKTQDDICIYARPNGEIVYSKFLLKENHLNSVTEKQLEYWLRLMLDWDPARRGRKCVDLSKVDPVVAFENLDNIMKTCVASIFWVDALKMLSYSIDDKTSIETVQEWIYRETGIKRQNQLLISPRGYPPDPLKNATQLLGGKELSITCLFSKQNDDTDSRLSPMYPEFLEIMLAEPKKETEYRIQKRMWAQSLFFIKKQESLYQKLLYALKLLSTHMTVKSALLKQQIDYINGAIRHAESCHDLFARSLQLDQQNYQLQSQRGGLASSTLPEKWNQEELLLQLRLRELEKRYSILDQTVREILRSSNTSARAAAVFLSKTDDTLDSLFQSAVELYLDLSSRSTERKQELNDNVMMTKIIVRTLKARQQLYTDCFAHIRVVEKFASEVDHLSPQLLVIKTEIDQFQEQMLQLQSQRQNEVWTLLERAVNLWQRTSHLNENDRPPSSNASDPSIITIPSLGISSNTAQETLFVIKENQSLRYKIQDLLSQRLSATCASSSSLDFGLLDLE